MKTISTRLYPDSAAAQAAYDALLENAIRAESMDMIHGDGDVNAKLRAAEVTETAAGIYASHMNDGRVLLVVRAPFGVAATATRTLEEFPSIDVGMGSEDKYIKAQAEVGSILKSHPLLMSNKYGTRGSTPVFGKNQVMRGVTKNSAIKGGAVMSKFFWPMKLVSSGNRKKSAISGGMLFSDMMKMPTVIRR